MERRRAGRILIECGKIIYDLTNTKAFSKAKRVTISKSDNMILNDGGVALLYSNEDLIQFIWPILTKGFKFR